MRNKCKKIFSGVLASALVVSALSFAACGDSYSIDEKLNYTTPTTAAKDNGGFSVEYGDYVYFINGQETYTVDNEFGEVTKGALMRIKTSDLKNRTNSAQTVVPMLFVAQNFDSGIYIYGDYVYYATPTTGKNLSGAVESSWIDFKRAKLDGTDTMKDYYFRLSNNAANYRFVEAGEDKTVYCLYEEEGALKSFNTKTGENTVLVKGATASGDTTYFFDKNDVTNPNVYYTMSVAPDAEAPNPLPAESYNQVYCVNAAATVDGGVKEANGKVSYTVKGGATYSFNRAYMEEKNDEAKNDDDDTTEEPYDFEDYTTFPYVNLGSLVLDGIGSTNTKTQFNESKTADIATPEGYTYTVKSAQNGGIYFTRTEVMKSGTNSDDKSLYYLADKTGDWNAITANGNVQTVAYDTANTDSALFYIEDNTHKYMYFKDTALYRVDGKDAEAVRLTAKAPSGATLWKTEGEYLYYTAASSEGAGNQISRIKYVGERTDYEFLPTEEFQPQTIAYLNYNAAWYMPEIYGDTVLYSNVKTFGAGSGYNYVYAAKITDIEGQNEAYNKVQDYIAEYSANADLQSAMRYYFRTGETKAFDAVKDTLYDEYQREEFETFKNNTNFKKESDFITLIGAMTEADAEAIEEAWVNYLRTETEDATESEGLETWAIVLIVVGSVLVVAAAVLVPVLMHVSKKKKEEKVAEETVNAYKRNKIDTTDDKSIDVYADETEETAEETTEETTEETVEEVTETEAAAEEVAEEATETVEEPAQEAAETPVEATAEETQE